MLSPECCPLNVVTAGDHSRQDGHHENATPGSKIDDNKEGSKIDRALSSIVNAHSRQDGDHEIATQEAK
jgi:hypothetical protein